MDFDFDWIMRDFRQYDIWKDSLELAVKIYRLTCALPDVEKFNLTTQLNRAVTSVSNNIAEGSAKTSEIDFARFLEISLGSCFEVENLLILSQKLNYLNIEELNEYLPELHSLQKRISGFIHLLRKK